MASLFSSLQPDGGAEHADIKLLCSIGGEPPKIVTIDEQAKTVDGLNNLIVFKVVDKGVWLIRER